MRDVPINVVVSHDESRGAAVVATGILAQPTTTEFTVAHFCNATVNCRAPRRQCRRDVNGDGAEFASLLGGRRCAALPNRALR